MVQFDGDQVSSAALEPVFEQDVTQVASAWISPRLQPFTGICLMPGHGRSVGTKVTVRNSTQRVLMENPGGK